MKEVTKEEFKAIFLKYGKSEGLGEDSWNKSYESPRRENMRYLVELPKNSKENKMMIVSDYSENEFRLFFMTEDRLEGFFDFPGKD